MFRSVNVAALVLLAASPALAAGFSGPAVSGYQPVHLLKNGTTTKTVVPGTVLVQVTVSAKGVPSGARVVASKKYPPIAADDGPAIDVANSAKYAPAIKNGSPASSFFDYAITFTSNGVAGLPAGPLGSYEAMLRTGQFDAAKSGLTTYLGGHPDDTKAQLDLALADAFLTDTSDAAAIFVKIDPIPDSDRNAALNSLNDAAIADSNAKKYDEGLIYAKRRVALDQDYAGYATLGFVQLQSGDNADAITNLEKSRSLATSATSKERSIIDVNLVSAYLATGAPDKATTLAAEAKTFDPTVNVGVAFGNYYVGVAKTKEAANDFSSAAAAWDAGAQKDPADGVTLYAGAAFDCLKMQPPDNDRAKGYAEKALAIDPTDAEANYVDGIALANLRQTDKAIDALKKADAAAKAKGLTQLQTSIEASLKQLNAS